MPPLSPRILIIDDDRDNIEVIELMLRYSNAAYEISHAQTPEAGLNMAAAQRFDLYLLDYRFEGMSGLDVCRSIRRMDADTPIVFFTGEAYERMRREALQAGANAYLVKPDDLKELAGTVKRLLGWQRHHSNSGIAVKAVQEEATV